MRSQVEEVLVVRKCAEEIFSVHPCGVNGALVVVKARGGVEQTINLSL